MRKLKERTKNEHHLVLSVKNQLGAPIIARIEGAECRICHIIKVFGSLQAFGKIAGLDTKYQVLKGIS